MRYPAEASKHDEHKKDDHAKPAESHAHKHWWEEFGHSEEDKSKPAEPKPEESKAHKHWWEDASDWMKDGAADEVSCRPS